jgi:hypothetical protein
MTIVNTQPGMVRTTERLIGLMPSPYKRELAGLRKKMISFASPVVLFDTSGKNSTYQTKQKLLSWGENLIGIR